MMSSFRHHSLLIVAILLAALSATSDLHSAQVIKAPDATTPGIADYRAGKFASIDDFPTVNQWKTQYFKTSNQSGFVPRAGKHANVDVHHSVEKYISNKLGIPAHLWDECPGIPMLRRKVLPDDVGPFHGGMAIDGGLSATLQSADNIPTNMAFQTTAERQLIVERLRTVYLEKVNGCEDYWLVARDWLRKLQQQGHLEQGLNILD